MNTSSGPWRLSGHDASAGACERVMTRDGTVGRSDATERSLPLHWDIDPARVMRPRFADSIRASSPRRFCVLVSRRDLARSEPALERRLIALPYPNTAHHSGTG